VSGSDDPLRIEAAPAVERLAAYYARMVAPRPLAYRSRAEWVARRPELRRQIRASLGIDPAPARLPLDVHRGGTLARPGYAIERLYWQTWPGVYASGWLYRPDAIADRLPAILNFHGHWPGGATHPTVQSRMVALAKQGYVALVVDTVHLDDYATGLNPAGVMTWNNLRALDLLVSLPEVDGERIGVTGESGGAHQLMYLVALDDRPRAAVSAVLVSYFHRILFPHGHHCPCNHVPGLMRFADELDVMALFAPKPLLFLTVTGDWTKPFPDEELLEFRHLYRLYGQPDRLDHVQFDGPHDYSRPMRERMYAWFDRWLRDRPQSEGREPEVTLESPETLASLERPPAAHRGWEGVIEYYREHAPRQPPRLESRDTRKRWQATLRAELRELLGETAPPVALAPRTHGVHEQGGVRIERLSFASEADVRIPALLLLPRRDELAPVAVLLDPRGKEAWFAGGSPVGLAADLLGDGWALLLPDLRLRGELALDWRYNTILWGRPEAGMAARDVIAAVDLVARRAELDWRRIVVAGWGDQGVVALLAAGWDERIAAAAADCAGTTYRDGGDGLPLIPNVLRVADVPQIAALVAPRPLWLFGVPRERLGFPSLRYFDFTRRMYQGLGAAEALRMASEPLPSEAFRAWLAHRWRRLPRSG